MIIFQLLPYFIIYSKIRKVELTYRGHIGTLVFDLILFQSLSDLYLIILVQELPDKSVDSSINFIQIAHFFGFRLYIDPSDDHRTNAD